MIPGIRIPDSVRWDLIVKAVEAHTDAVRVVPYVERWPGAGRGEVGFGAEHAEQGLALVGLRAGQAA
ncbi:hypothetical protein ACFU7Y_05085 [Kitasatospora sp. NPDC057542]|uniref:hypothetical protein n=1 Tax=Kitasatospora sp. NPDC057542 TaxID=3346162 RepID=UPI003691E0C3